MGNKCLKSPDVVKKALLIGINYTGTPSALNGCINDTIHLKEFLINNKLFENNDFTVMTDNETENLLPTKKNIESMLNELVSFANMHQDKKRVEMFLSYSGHGAYIPDLNGDEDDGRDEVLCPLDYYTSGFIVDDYLKAEFIDKLPSNVHLVIMVDACHSGTAFDLRYNLLNDNKNHIKLSKNKNTKCHVIMISGCLDNQTSADAYLMQNGGYVYKFQGAMTASFISSYRPGISSRDLISKMRTSLKSTGFTQVPQLSSGNFIDVLLEFPLNKFTKVD